MPEKKIIITITPDSIIVQPHLKKPDKIELSIEGGMTPMETIKVMAVTLSSLINDFDAKLRLLENNSGTIN